MYKNFFGLNERPFKLVPNSAYLFLSKSHEEALAHLTYAVVQGEGFMEITGEVGTGKTTLCRAFLDHLDNDTKAAYIFNPNLDSVELLKAINCEFGIPSDADNIKDLIDTLNTFLIEQKTQGKNTILLIDEAQNLTNEVLEQLRLLSNLETEKHKLLHIILVGQPELKEKLNSHELRQLRQRISLSCQLIPLSFKDVRNYIQHRINVASGNSDIQFADAAYRSIYSYSQGIPRLVNIVCDRALLTAFSLDQKEITQKIVRSSIRELKNRRYTHKNSYRKPIKAILLFSILPLIIFMIIYFHPGLDKVYTIFNPPETNNVNAHPSDNTKKPVIDVAASDVKNPAATETGPVKKEKGSTVTVFESKKNVPATTAPELQKSIPDVTPVERKESIPVNAVSESKRVIASVIASKSSKTEVQQLKAPEPVIEPVRDMGNLLKTMNRLPSRHMAMKLALNLWNIEPDIAPTANAIDDDQDFFRQVSKENNLLMRRITGNLNTIKKLNLPVILAVHPKKGMSPIYFVLIKIDAQKVTLRGGKKDVLIELSPVELESYWAGVAYIPWKNFLSLTGTIPIDSPKDSITTLKILLRDIGFKEIEITPIYDDTTRQAVTEIQKKYGLHIDGKVGSTTKIALYNEKKGFKQPRIVNASNSLVR